VESELTKLKSFSRLMGLRDGNLIVNNHHRIKLHLRNIWKLYQLIVLFKND